MQESATRSAAFGDIMSEDEVKEFKDSVKNIEKNITKIREDFTSFCIAITGRVITLETKNEAHEISHIKEQKMNDEFEERLNKRASRQLVILGLILTAAMVLVNVLVKVL